MIVGGTAGATPLLAGLTARINQGLGRNLGYFNPDLYQRIGPQGTFRDIVYGDNGTKDVKGYVAGPGWEPLPDGEALMEGNFLTRFERRQTPMFIDYLPIACERGSFPSVTMFSNL
jgi:hypothetical protein